jgi:hypothetical protein
MKSIDILIIGDSWGVPNYSPDNYIKKRIADIKKISSNAMIQFRHLGDPPETHLEFLLKDCGYNVVNLSRSGGSNLEVIQKAFTYLDDNKVNIDWIIWFHTESLRDRDKFLTSKNTKFSIPVLAKDLAIKAYKEFATLVRAAKCRSVVIGGQAPVYFDVFFEYVGEVDFLIADWHAEILGVELPFSHGVCNIDLFELPNCIDSIEEKNKMLDDIDLILKLDYDSEDFPDNAHPGKAAHKALFDKIINVIEKKQI